VSADAAVNWSEDLEELHRHSSGTHFLDRWTRAAILHEVEPALAPGHVVVDLGCSAGHLLEDLRVACSGLVLVGLDLVAPGLAAAHQRVPEALLLRADAAAVPLDDEAVDAVVSANLLEHVEDDLGVLREARRILRPGGRAVFVVPYGRTLYDYYDAHLGHVRRYALSELPRKAAAAGLRVVRRAGLGTLLYAPFWLRKKVNRLRIRSADDAERAARVAHDISATQDSRVGLMLCALEQGLFERGLSLPVGIRTLVVAVRD